MLKGLNIEPARIYASTLFDQDVAEMKTSAITLPKHIFQFDFLNDEFLTSLVLNTLKQILNALIA